TSGTIEGTISASGTVVPRLEQLVSSPVETRILSVSTRPGATVKQGESLLRLDDNEVTLSLERTEKELALKENRRAQLKLEITKTLNDLKSQLNIKELRLKYLQSKSEQGEKMLSLGALSKDQYDQTKLEEQIAVIERNDLEESIQSATQSLENQLDGITTEVNTLLKERADIQRQLEMLSCKAERDGVVTWLNEDIGASIHRGDIVARVADLSSYLVEGSVSDIHAERLAVGMEARIRLNERNFFGKLSTVYPTIENGIAKFLVALDDSSTKFLRPNIRVDIYVITSKKEHTLIVKKGAFVQGQSEQPIFIIKENVAMRVPARIGIVSFDGVEILEGASAGDEIIISDIKEYEHLAQMKVH
ncbi:MAG: HlyD family efflux transporter periplasmic adaptor subunit, partial [Bacteroidetes bacterium]